MSAPEFSVTSTTALAAVSASTGPVEMSTFQQSPLQQSRALPQSPSGGLTAQQQQHHQRSVKRPRPVKSCTECRKRKLRCDRLCPCSQCQKSNRTCKYAADYDSGNLSDGSDAEMESGRPAKRAHGSSTGQTAPAGGEPGPPSNSRLSAERPPPLGTGFIEELAVRMDRLEKHILPARSSELRHGGEGLIQVPSATVRGLSIKREGRRTRLFGASSTRVMLNLFEDAKAFLVADQHTTDLDDTLADFCKLHRSLHEEYQDSIIPMTVFVDSVMPVWKRMMDILPQKPVCDRLIARYMDISEAICRILHFPTFRKQYDLFWEGKLQSEYFLPQLLAVLAIVSRFTTKSQGFSHERMDGVHTPTAFALVRTWVDGLKGKQLTDIAVLQVELLLMVCRRALMFRPHELWTHLGGMVRMAMTLGLHRDPSEFGSRISPFLGEIRRRLWFAVFELDVQNSFDCDMPCAIREGDYSCRPPRNLDDDDLHPDMKELPPGKPVEEPTEMQAQVLGCLSINIRARICHLLCRIDTVHDYREVLALGEKLEDILEDTNQIIPRVGISDHSRMSRVWRERVSLDSHVRRALLALYRPFALGAQDCPPQLTKSFMRSCMVVLGYSEELGPLLPHHPEVMGMLHQVFKNDILPAAFSICYYIQASVQTHVNGAPQDGFGRLRQPTDSPSRSPRLPATSRLMWSPERLIQAVERTLGYFIQSIVRNTGTKDIVTLSVVLEMARKPNPRSEDIARALRTTLDGCLKAANSSREKLAMMKPGQAQASTPGFAAESYIGGQSGQGAFRYGEAGLGHRNPLGPLEGRWPMWGGWE